MSTRAIVTQGHGQFAPKGQNLKDLCRRRLNIAIYKKIIVAVCLVVSED